MNQRQYESGLKNLLEDLAEELEKHDAEALNNYYLPTNVPGVKPLSVGDWLRIRQAPEGF